MKKILQVGNAILEKKSKGIISSKQESTQKLIKDLIQICKAKEKTSAGLAAPQIGCNKRVFVARRIDLEDQYRKSNKELPDELSSRLWTPFINPKIKKRGNRKNTYWEGCLSIGEGKAAIFGPVTRPSFVKISYLDRYGNKKTITAVDFFAHIIQHEIDHLNGILFIHHIENPKNLWKSKDLDEYLKKTGEYPEIVT